MSGLLLDTDICVEILRKNTRVLARARKRRQEEVFISAITVGELFYGARRADPARREGHLHQVIEFAAAARILPFDAKAAEKYGEFKASLAERGQLIGDNDILIASITVTHSLVLVSNNLQHFERMIPFGLQVEAWG